MFETWCLIVHMWIRTSHITKKLPASLKTFWLQGFSLFHNVPFLPCNPSPWSSQPVCRTSPGSSWCALCLPETPHVAASGETAPAAPGNGCASPPWSQSDAAPPEWAEKRWMWNKQREFTFDYMHSGADKHLKQRTEQKCHWKNSM